MHTLACLILTGMERATEKEVCICAALSEDLLVFPSSVVVKRCAALSGCLVVQAKLIIKLPCVAESLELLVVFDVFDIEEPK